MASLNVPITDLVLSQLAAGEMRMLSLVVAVRRRLEPGDRITGDLSAVVKTAIRKLVLSKAVTESDGVFSITPIVTPVARRF